VTVRELIEKLKDMPPEAVVLAREGDGGLFEVKSDDVETATKAFYGVGRGPVFNYGYWERPWDGRKGQMVVVISP
jgi:hypothetical protein